jgi:hypothetical protein
MTLFETMLDCNCYFALWGIRDPRKVAQMIASFAEMCATVRRSGKKFTAIIEIPGDVENIARIHAEVARILHRSTVAEFRHGDFHKMSGSRGRLDGKITFQTR